MENKTNLNFSNHSHIDSIKWFAPEFEYIKKSSNWFWAFWIVSLGIIIISIDLHNILFAILIFFITFTLSLQSTRKPKLVKFEINNKELITPYRKYPLENIKTYWVEYNKKFPQLLLQQKQNFLPLLTIPLGEVSIPKIEGILISSIKKEEISESFFIKLIKYF